MNLSLLCVTRAEDYSAPFLEHYADVARRLALELCIVADGDDAAGRLESRVPVVHSRGYIESVLDAAISTCTCDYILRIDDDERLSPSFVQWLQRGEYQAHDHWCFPRAHLWGDTETVIMTPHLWPDWQTRLSVHAKSGGRTGVHQGSPFGGGTVAPVWLEHHKFLVKSYDERLRIAKEYDRYHSGYGTGNMRPFSLPEDCYTSAQFVRYADGVFTDHVWKGPLCPSNAR